MRRRRFIRDGKTDTTEPPGEGASPRASTSKFVGVPRNIRSRVPFQWREKREGYCFQGREQGEEREDARETYYEAEETKSTVSTPRKKAVIKGQY